MATDGVIQQWLLVLLLMKNECYDDYICPMNDYS